MTLDHTRIAALINTGLTNAILVACGTQETKFEASARSRRLVQSDHRLCSSDSRTPARSVTFIVDELARQCVLSPLYTFQIQGYQKALDLPYVLTDLHQASLL